MAITSRAERKSRRMDALSKLNTGWGVGDTISYLVRDYKITRRSANLDVAWASTELCKNFDRNDKYVCFVMVMKAFRCLSIA